MKFKKFLSFIVMAIFIIDVVAGIAYGILTVLTFTMHGSGVMTDGFGREVYPAPPFLRPASPMWAGPINEIIDTVVFFGFIAIGALCIRGFLYLRESINKEEQK